MQMSMSVPTIMLVANTSASTQEVPISVSATVATTCRLMRRVVQPHLKVLVILLSSVAYAYVILLYVYALWYI